MRNVWRIFKDDLRLVGSSIVSVLIVLGLCLAPAVCAWTGIIANWNPHDNTGRLKVAVSNGDDGYESSLMPIRLNIGDRVVSLLRENDDYDWVFVDEWKAIEGVRSGEYYAALTIPRETDCPYPRALPIAITCSPMRRELESPSPAMAIEFLV